MPRYIARCTSFCAAKATSKDWLSIVDVDLTVATVQLEAPAKALHLLECGFGVEGVVACARVSVSLFDSMYRL